MLVSILLMPKLLMLIGSWRGFREEEEGFKKRE